MPACQRLGDANSAGGVITTIPQSTVFANGQLVSVDGSIGTGHAPCPIVPIHCAGAWATAGGSGNVFINGIPVNFTGNSDTCGHTRVGGSGTVNIN